MTQLPSFDEFFEAVHHVKPFPWQSRLADEVLSNGWPDLLDLPTGAGKTSALDVALFCLACAPERLPRRTVLVVDRRIVVDQGADHARKLLTAMLGTRSGPVKVVADALRALSWNGDQDQAPFSVAVMRGGMPRDNDWAKRPDQPVLGVSTVDQLGSRLLFRGYGVSARSASIHAGLIGNDTLILLDEVHLAVPFEQTLSQIREHFSKPERSLPQRFGVVRMSATANARRSKWRVFGLGDSDREHPVLAKRLTASKRARLALVKVKGEESERRATLARAAVEQAIQLQKNARIVAVVVNRIDTARAVHDLLARQHAESTDAALVTGRMRPIDRDQLVRDVLAQRIGPREKRSSADRPLVLVATQCIEAGADLDFDAMVTECASLDALKQRFGRLDRQGLLRESNAVILARSDAVSENADDPIYGQALSATWRWLEAIARDRAVDFGISALPVCLDEHGQVRQDVLASFDDAPVLLPSTLDALAQTSPVPATDPDVSLWLHGPARPSAEVQLIWRTELTLEPGEAIEGADSAHSERPDTDSPAAARAKRIPDEVRQTAVVALTARRPSSLEAISLPIYAARQWLSEEPSDPVSDLTTNVATQGPERRGRRNTREPGVVALRWRGEDSEFISADEIRPGDVLIVPCTYGGIKAGTFDPAAQTSVADVGDLAELRARGRASLLLRPDALKIWALAALDTPPLPDEDETLAETRDRIAGWFAKWPPSRPAECPATDVEWTTLATAITGGRARVNVVNGTLLVKTAPVRDRRTTPHPEPEVTELLTEDDDSSFRDKEVTLAQHSTDVRSFTEGFAQALGFDERMVSDLALSAWLHDVGKADPRFQRWLVGGSDVRAALAVEPLAKSSLPPGSYAERRRARRRAGYPEGYRHELLSLSMIENERGRLAEAHDPELVLHLVASHHGWCRPFPPFTDHPDDLDVALNLDGVEFVARTRHRKALLDSGVATRFWTLVDRYGWWGLAWLEAVLRLADHRASQKEAEEQQ